MVATVRKHCWPSNGKDQVELAKAGNCEFSHPDGIPIQLSVRRIGFCRRKIIAIALERIWYRDAVGEGVIEKGFTWDLASIPGVLWNFVSPFELAYESGFHDLGYRKQLLTRQYVDFQFLYLMQQRGQPWYVRYSAWLAVRLFGGKTWKKYRLRNERERKRNERHSH